MKKQHTQKMTVRVTAQTAYNLERLMLMSGQKTPGRVAVHAGRLDEVQATKHLTNGEFWAVLEAAGGGGNLPRGAVIGTVEIVDCVPVEELVDSLDNRERLLGDYSPGRFAWVLQNPVMFKTPIPANGKQGWWNWEEPT